MKPIPNERFFAWVEAEIAEGRTVRFRLKGSSMFPLIRNERDVVVLSPCVAQELRVMDVVLFRYRGKHVLHRIIRKEGSRLMLQGDGSYVAKEQCEVTEVVGKVRQIVRPSGRCIEVEGWRWKCCSHLWRCLGVLRSPVLRILHKLFPGY